MGIFDKLKKKEPITDNMYLYTKEECNLYEKFIAKEFGEFKEILHEFASPDIHLDIIIIPPTTTNNYYKLITMGMGTYRMNIPKELEQFELERAELVLYLPPTWNIQSDKEEDYWPIRQLKNLARLPIHDDSWLGHGHTISFTEENTPYANNTEFCCMMLLSALNKDCKLLNLSMETKGKINFYQLIPLYKEELILLQNTNLDTLLDLFDVEDIIVNTNRKNYADDIK